MGRKGQAGSCKETDIDMGWVEKIIMPILLGRGIRISLGVRRQTFSWGRLSAHSCLAQGRFLIVYGAMLALYSGLNLGEKMGVAFLFHARTEE
jgi:hypothetical protein